MAQTLFLADEEGGRFNERPATGKRRNAEAATAETTWEGCDCGRGFRRLRRLHFRPSVGPRDRASAADGGADDGVDGA